ncbi:MAG TPA: hypothetical protein VJX23_03250 [Candidatus Binataceae bacterium]|nr:hypothetical protein [Candidatus Binataceae bacterium]
MLPELFPRTDSRPARVVTWALVGLNAALLLIAIPDYRVSIDSGYHISLAQQYAAHGAVWWDHINFGPGGRPNLQGPALHIAIAILGTIFGGSPGAFIIANAILGLIQWLAAIFTVMYFARRLGGDMAAMFAVALLAGSAYASGSFSIGIPSGWLFISIPWAIYFFLEERLVLATLILSITCYTHLGGFVTGPIGVAIAAALTRRWRSFIIVGVATAILTAPYSIHFVSNLAWYRGQHGHESIHFDLLIDFLAIAGVILFFRRPVQNGFLVAWTLAPIAWLLQDFNRFAAQSTLAGSVLGGLFVADMIRRIGAARIRIALATATVAIATILPLGIPNLLAEITWDAGLKFPRPLDWERARAIAAVIDRNHLNDRLVAVYENSFGPAIAVFTPVTLQRGHWVEVQPKRDPALDLSAGVKLYVIPLAPDDPVLRAMEERGLLRVWGGTADTAVMTLDHRGDPDALRPIVMQILEDNAEWLGHNAIDNEMAPPAVLIKRLHPAALEAHRREMDVQRSRAGRMEVACLVYAYSIEPISSHMAQAFRNRAWGFAEMGSFLSDDDPLGYISDDRHRQFRDNMLALAQTLKQSPAQNPFFTPEVSDAFDRLFDDYFGGAA